VNADASLHDINPSLVSQSSPCLSSDNNPDASSLALISSPSGGGPDLDDGSTFFGSRLLSLSDEMCGAREAHTDATLQHEELLRVERSVIVRLFAFYFFFPISEDGSSCSRRCGPNPNNSFENPIKQEIHQLFVDMAMLVERQAYLVNQIDHFVDQAVDYTDRGKNEIVKAIKYQKSHRKKICWIIICLLILVGLVIIIMYVLFLVFFCFFLFFFLRECVVLLLFFPL
jgi:hypothetical protein